jgi:RNA polymerase sigma-70 factor (ECF subfamily)
VTGPRPTDEELLLAPSGDPDGRAFGELYARHEALIVAFHLRRVGDPERAADLAAETFAQALVARARFIPTGEDAATRWLYGIAGNVLRNSVRRQAVESRALARLGLDRPHLDDAALDAITSAATDDSVVRALAALPAAQQEAIRAVVLGDEDYGAVAERTGVDPATVRQRVSRGLRSLRRTMEETR